MLCTIGVHRLAMHLEIYHLIKTEPLVVLSSQTYENQHFTNLRYGVLGLFRPYYKSVPDWTVKQMCSLSYVYFPVNYFLCSQNHNCGKHLQL